MTETWRANTWGNPPNLVHRAYALGLGLLCNPGPMWLSSSVRFRFCGIHWSTLPGPKRFANASNLPYPYSCCTYRTIHATVTDSLWFLLAETSLPFPHGSRVFSARVSPGQRRCMSQALDLASRDAVRTPFCVSLRLLLEMIRRYDVSSPFTARFAMSSGLFFLHEA